MGAPLAEGRAPHHVQVERDGGPHALHDEGLQGRLHAGDRVLARCTRGHELGQQRVVVYRNLAAFGDPVIVLESMKMEIPVEAPRAGKVKEIKVAEGQTVQEGETVAVLD